MRHIVCPNCNIEIPETIIVIFAESGPDEFIVLGRGFECKGCGAAVTWKRHQKAVQAHFQRREMTYLPLIRTKTVR